MLSILQEFSSVQLISIDFGCLLADTTAVGSVTGTARAT